MNIVTFSQRRHKSTLSVNNAWTFCQGKCKIMKKNGDRNIVDMQRLYQIITPKALVKAITLPSAYGSESIIHG